VAWLHLRELDAAAMDPGCSMAEYGALPGPMRDRLADKWGCT
jgi:hypothetical protein